MIPDTKTLDDLKTERAGISPPLPLVFRLIPLLFFLSLVGGILLTGLFALRLTEATSLRDQHLEAEKSSLNELQQTREQVLALEARAKRASDLLNWTESARPIQPMLVALGRSVNEDMALTELQLTRNEDAPNQLRISLRMNTTSVEHLERLLASLQKFGYRPFSPEQKFTSGEINYQAMLIWQSPDLATSTPTEEEAAP